MDPLGIAARALCHIQGLPFGVRPFETLLASDTDIHQSDDEDAPHHQWHGNRPLLSLQCDAYHQQHDNVVRDMIIHVTEARRHVVTPRKLPVHAVEHVAEREEADVGQNLMMPQAVHRQQSAQKGIGGDHVGCVPGSGHIGCHPEYALARLYARQAEDWTSPNRSINPMDAPLMVAACSSGVFCNFLQGNKINIKENMGASESQTGSLHTLAAVRQRRANIASQDAGRQRLHPHSMFTLNENNKFQHHIIGPSALFGDGEFLLI